MSHGANTNTPAEGSEPAAPQHADVPPTTPTDELVAVEEVEGRYVHPDAVALFRRVPFIRNVPMFGPATEAFGYKCVASLGLVYLLNKGIGNQIIGYAKYPMFIVRFGVEASVYQRMSSIAKMGWSIKALTAVFTDTFALFGYTKRWYQVGSCVVGAASAVGYGLLPADPSSAGPAAGLIFITSYCMANIDVLSEGHYSRLIRRSPKPGTDLITWIWCFIMLGAIIASAIQGPISDLKQPQIGVFISGALQFVCVFIYIFNLNEEKRNTVLREEDRLFFLSELRCKDEEARRLQQDALDADAIGNALKDKSDNDSREPTSDPLSESEMVGYSHGADDFELARGAAAVPDELDAELAEPLPSCCCNVWEMNKEVVQRNIKVVVYGLLMAAGVVTMAIVTMIGTTRQMMYGCVIVSAFLCSSAFFCLPLTAAKANLYIYIQAASYLLIPGALDSFYLAGPECLPDGPQFSQTFYNTVGAVIGNVAGLFGVFMFNRVFSRYSYRLTFIVTTIIYVIASVFDLIIVERWNRPRVNDHAIYILGDAVVYNVCYMLNFMPSTILISRLCPKGSETTMYAILAGFGNLGQSMSSVIGSILMETHFPVKASVPCDFSNVKWLIIIGHMCTPLICIPIVFFLIPSVRVCDNLPLELVEAPPLSVHALYRKVAFWKGSDHAAADAAEARQVNQPDAAH